MKDQAPDVFPVKEGDDEVTGTALPDTEATLTIVGKDGKEKFKDSHVVVDKDGKWSVKPGVDIEAGDKVTITDAKGKQDTETAAKKGIDPSVPDEDGLSSNLSERCINTGLGIGLPLLFLIPVGLASQMNIPGLSDFLAPINKQIQDLNMRLQQQTNTFNGPLAKQMAGIDAQLKRFGADYHQAAGAVALIAAGALAIGLLADACAPGADEEGSSK